jgi:hypothetical protein
MMMSNKKLASKLMTMRGECFSKPGAIRDRDKKNPSKFLKYDLSCLAI